MAKLSIKWLTSKERLNSFHSFVVNNSLFTTQNNSLHTTNKHNSGKNHNQLTTLPNLKSQTSLLTNVQKKSKLKTVMLSVLFLQYLKTSSSKFRRKTLLYLGMKPKSINLPKSINEQYPEITMPNEQHSTVSTRDLIFKNNSILNKSNTMMQFTLGSGNTITRNIHEILNRCLYETVRE